MVAIIPSVVLEKRSGLLHITGLEMLAGLLSDPRRVELTRLRGIPRIVEWRGLLSKPRWNKLVRPPSVPLVIDWSGLSIPLLWDEWACPERWLSHHEVVENGPGRQCSVLGQEAPVLRSRALGLRCWRNPLPRKPQAEVLVEILIFHC